MISNQTFYLLLNMIAPLYILVFIGFMAGRLLKVDRKSIASLLFYFIIPVVFFNYALKIDFEPSYLGLPLVTFLFAITLSISFYNIGLKIWPQSKLASVLGFSAGSGNTGYFGLPIAIMIFEPNIVGLYMLANIGISISDYTIGAYFFSRSEKTPKQAIIEVTKLPMIYAFALGCILNQIGFRMSDEISTVVDYMRGTYVTLGMMIVGLGLSTVDKIKFNFKFTATLLSVKYFIAPLLMFSLVMLDRTYFNIYDIKIHEALMLISFVPPAANTVVFAQLHNCHPEEAASAIAAGTLLALLYLPIVVGTFIVF